MSKRIEFRTTVTTVDCPSMLNTKRRKCVLLIVFTVGGIYSMMRMAENSDLRIMEMHIEKNNPVKMSVNQEKRKTFREITTSITQTTAKTTTTTTTTTTTATTTEAKRLPTTASWIEKADEMSFVDDDILRCKAQNLGCFVAIEHPDATYTKISMAKMDKAAPFKDSCLDACYKSENHLAGYNVKSRTCLCSDKFEGFLSHKVDMSVAFSWDLSQKCKHSKSLHVYSIARSCERGVSQQTMEEDRVGCIKIPKSLNRAMIALKNSQATGQQCILNCELRGFTYAIPALKKNVCLCSDSYSLFGKAENMKKTMEVCDKKHGHGRASVYRTMIDDDNCAPIKFLNLGQAPPILLASYYGSGNTWIRHLIEASTGVYTGSVYRDKKLYEGGMLGEMIAFDKGRIVAVKDHLFKLAMKPGFRMAILLLRNPYDATLAEWSRRRTKNHTGVVDQQTFRSPGFKKYAEHRPEYWFGIANVVLKTFSKVLVVYYEDLKQDAVKEMRRIVEFLPRNLAPTGEDLERRIMCMNLDLVGKFKRPPRKLDFDPFDAYIRNGFDQKIRDLDDLLIEYHQPPLPDSYFLPS